MLEDGWVGGLEGGDELDELAPKQEFLWFFRAFIGSDMIFSCFQKL